MKRQLLTFIVLAQLGGTLGACTNIDVKTGCFSDADCFAGSSCIEGACITPDDIECGNGRVEPGETCDGDCLTECEDRSNCTADVLAGSADTCNVVCEFQTIELCVDDDGCCPSGCNLRNDSDCAASCGNGALDDGEACDDANELDGDYCAADCLSVTGFCGDGVEQEIEACDDGNTDDGDYCSPDCLTVTGECGDSTTQDNEQCDDGVNDGSYAGCNEDCALASFCGDDVLDEPEDCDGEVVADGWCTDECEVGCRVGFSDCNGDPSDGCECLVAQLAWLETSEIPTGVLPSQDMLQDVALVKETGEVFSVGHFANDTIMFNADEPTETTLTRSGVGEDLLMTRHNAHGGALDWAIAASGYRVEMNSVATRTDATRSSFVVGGKQRSSITLSEDIYLSDPGAFVAKYSPDGVVDWGRVIWDPRSQVGGTSTMGTALLSDETTIAAGYFCSGGTDCSAEVSKGEEDSQILSSDGGSDAFITRFGANGELLWAKSFGSNHADGIVDLATIPGDSVVAAGVICSGADSEDGCASTFAPGVSRPAQRMNACIARYTRSGVLSWVKCADSGNSEVRPLAIAPLADGSTVALYVYSLDTGPAPASVTFGKGEANETTFTSDPIYGRGAVVAKLSSDGSLLWAKQVVSGQIHHRDSFTPDRRFADLATTENGSVYTTLVANRFSATIFPGDRNEQEPGGSLSNHVLLLKLNADGTSAWAARVADYGHCFNEECSAASSIVAVSEGSVIVGGTISTLSKFARDTPDQTSVFNPAVFVARLDTGSPQSICRGIPDSCATREASTCTAATGCSPGLCQGTATACGDFTEWSECSDQTGCGWPFGECQGSAWTCDMFTGAGSCEDQGGCSWNTSLCHGTPTYCSWYTLETCTDQPGCAVATEYE